MHRTITTSVATAALTALILSGCGSDNSSANYVSTIMTKIHVASRAEAIVRARDAGFGAPSANREAPR